MNNQLASLRELQRQKYEAHKRREKVTLYSSILKDFSKDEIENVIDKESVEKIQKFIRKYRLSDKKCSNIEYLFDCAPDDIIKNRSNGQIYGYHYLTWEKHFDIRGYSDIKTDQALNLQNIQRINKLIKQKTKFKYQKMNNFKDYNCIYSGNYSKCWEFADMFSILEDRGMQKISVPQSLFTEMLTYEPGVYALEIVTNDSVNINKSYCMFNDFPLQDADEEKILTLPIGTYQQLKVSPNHNDFKMRVIKPVTGQRIKLKCFINSDEVFSDIKHQLTIELTRHKVISLNQIIAVESDVDHSIIPFLVTECLPSNIINITNVDLEIDFDPCFDFENPVESLFMYFNT